MWLNIHLGLNKVFLSCPESIQICLIKRTRPGRFPPESKITDTEYFMESHREEIVNFMEKKTVVDIAPTGTGDVFEGLLNRLINEFPFGELEVGGFYYDKFHAILANALIILILVRLAITSNGQ